MLSIDLGRVTAQLQRLQRWGTEQVADSNEDDEDDELLICSGCIAEEFLSEEVETKGRDGNCSYCKEDAKCFSIEEVADKVEAAFSEHYIRTSDQPDSMQSMMLADRESSYEWDRDGEPIAVAIMNAADIPESAAASIQEILEGRHYDHELAQMGEESDFSSKSHYEEAVASDARWQEEWSTFERSLKEENRFFSSSGLTLLNNMFGNIETLTAHSGRSPIVDAGPNTELTSLYRARAFQSDESLKPALARPDLHLGSPPAGLARAGRMNAHGISVFYGSNGAAAALAEVRPPVGCKRRDCPV